MLNQLPFGIASFWLDPVVFVTSLVWVLLRSFVTFVICFGLGLVGISFLNRITKDITVEKDIKGQPIATALFAAGMFIFLALTFVGSTLAPLPIGISSGMGEAVSSVTVIAFRLVTLAAGFILSLIFAVIFYEILGRVEPFGIDLNDVNKDSVATGIYVMGYLIFLGTILYASLLLPV